MAYTPKGYTDQAAIEDYMVIDIDPSYDTQVDEWIAAMEEYIDMYTGRDFTPSGDTATDRVYDGDGTSTLMIDPTSDFVSVKLSPTGTALDDDEYYLYPANKSQKNKIVLKYKRFPEGKQNIVVNAKFGVSEVPPSIKMAATILVAGIINFSWNSAAEVQSMTVGRYSVTYKSKKEWDDFNKLEELLDFNKKYTF